MSDAIKYVLGKRSLEFAVQSYLTVVYFPKIWPESYKMFLCIHELLLSKYVVILPIGSFFSTRSKHLATFASYMREG